MQSELNHRTKTLVPFTFEQQENPPWPKKESKVWVIGVIGHTDRGWRNPVRVMLGKFLSPSPSRRTLHFYKGIYITRIYELKRYWSKQNLFTYEKSIPLHILQLIVSIVWQGLGQWVSWAKERHTCLFCDIFLGQFLQIQFHRLFQVLWHRNNKDHIDIEWSGQQGRECYLGWQYCFQDK